MTTEQQPAPLCEEYLREYLGAEGAEDDDDNDPYRRLQRRERELVLAAELGKALLEKNEEISLANERLAEEYSRRLEVLEQEKHSLRRRLDTLGGEYDGRVAELQQELAQLREELEGQRLAHRRREADRSRLLDELTEQNRRLAAELRQAALAEEGLRSRVASAREQFEVRRSNLHDHVSQLEGLREEISLLTERKRELERRISALSDEREGLSASLEESGDRIAALERNARHHETQLTSQLRELEELRQANARLRNRLEAAEKGGGSGAASLHHEMSLHSVHEDDDDDEIECDDECLVAESSTTSGGKLGEDLLLVWRQLRRLCEDLRNRGAGGGAEEADSGISAGCSEEEDEELRPGVLSALAAELARLVEEELRHPLCRHVAEERDALERAERELVERREELKRRTDEADRLAAQVTLQEAELQTLRETRDQLRSDLESGALAKDQVVRRAWEVRDQAVARKNAVEIELARTRIDVMHVNSQLMEAVQQKIELSQQLEQWKMDMEALLDSQVMKKLKTQETQRQTTTVTAPPQASPSGGKGKLPSLFRLWR